MSASFVTLSLIDVLWFFLAFCFFVSFCAHKISVYVPRKYKLSHGYLLFQDLIRYGKTKQNIKRPDWLQVLDVPKRWFWHFYAISVVWNGFLLVLNLNFIYKKHPHPTWLKWVLDILTGPSSTNNQVPQLSTVVVQLLLCIHSFRRLLECLFVSVFSDGVIHLVQYVFGLFFYVGLGLTVLCSDHMERGTSSFHSQWNWIHVVGGFLFIAASFLQHRSMLLLARLRTGKSGAVETLAHKVPNGDLFELVSCPHYFAELLIYLSLSFVAGGGSLTWWLVVLYVFFNQALAGQLCHDHYISKYDSYPKHRKAFLPFVL